MSGKQIASGATTRKPGAKTFVAGLAIGAASVFYTGVDVGTYAWAHRDDGARLINSAIGKQLLPRAALFKETMYLAINIGKGQMDIFKVDFFGENAFSMKIEDTKTGNKGVGNGHERAGAIAFEFASASPSRPGFGSGEMRPYTSTWERDDPVYAGVVTFHDCQCIGSSSTRPDGPVRFAQALLTTKPLPSDELTKLFFAADQKAEKVPVLFPADVQRSREASAAGAAKIE